MHVRTLLIWVIVVACSACSAFAENIDPAGDGSQYAYGSSVGWLNFEPALGGATVSDEALTGYIWGANIGWINLSPAYGGVTNDGTGLLSGFAWGENVGWINFNPVVPGDPTHYGVTIDSEGNFDGWAWGENIGWIRMRAATPVAYKVQTSWLTGCMVGFDDVAAFSALWLTNGQASLAGYWPFNEGYGSEASDLAGGNTLSLAGDAGWGPGESGNFALSLDGAGGYAKSSDTIEGLDFAPGSFTISAWINPRTVTGQWRAIAEYDRAGDNWFGIWLDSSGRFHFRVGLDKRSSEQVLEPDRWYLVAGTYDASTKQLSLFIDGRYDSSASHLNGLYSAPAASKLTVGVRGTEDDEFFDGRIDELRIYSRSMDAGEIRGLLWGFGGDFDADGTVDFTDYNQILERWLQLCPPGWPLK